MPESTAGMELNGREQLTEVQTRPSASAVGIFSTERLPRLYDAVRSFSSTLVQDSLLPQILTSATHLVEARGGFLMLADDQGQSLKCEVVTGIATAGLKGATLPIDERTVPGLVASRGVAYVENDVGHNPYFAAQQTKGHTSIHKLLCVPLKTKERTIGVIQVIERLTGQDFNEDDRKLLAAMAESAAVAIENSRLYEVERKKAEMLTQAYEELNKTYRATVLALSGLLDARDNATKGHGSRVVVLTLRLARAMGITDQTRLRMIEQGALLHDVGQISVADNILKKPGPLDADEWREMRAHPEIGYKMLKDIEFLKNALSIVRYHHERYNGTGYPYGLEGREIPLEARIFAVADAFDAITTERPYKKARSFEQAVGVLKADSGKYFDPEVVKAFLTVPKEEWVQILRQVSEATG